MKVNLMKPEFAVQMAIAYDKYLNGKNGLIYFGAGEPLLNWDAIVRVCEELEQRQSKIELRFMTNASNYEQVGIYKST
jgi:sulfatase maturation enzyme AslB (radical SAM superfamily)